MVHMEGYLWKKGKHLFHMISKRYYLMSGNCMYYYTNKDDIRPRGRSSTTNLAFLFTWVAKILMVLFGTHGIVLCCNFIAKLELICLIRIIFM